ncbi:hypothetical protein JCM8547_001146 [Rhodosporidiobolus lusitaniae]
MPTVHNPERLQACNPVSRRAGVYGTPFHGLPPPRLHKRQMLHRSPLPSEEIARPAHTVHDAAYAALHGIHPDEGVDPREARRRADEYMDRLKQVKSQERREEEQTIEAAQKRSRHKRKTLNWLPPYQPDEPFQSSVESAIRSPRPDGSILRSPRLVQSAPNMHFRLFNPPPSDGRSIHERRRIKKLQQINKGCFVFRFSSSVQIMLTLFHYVHHYVHRQRSAFDEDSDTD